MSDTLLWNEIGTIYQKMGLLDESIQAYKKALDVSPDSVQSNNNLAQTFFQKEDYGQAIELYRKSISLLRNPKDQAVVWNRIGDVYRAMKDLDSAFAAYRKADELEMRAGAAPVQSVREQIPTRKAEAADAVTVRINRVQNTTPIQQTRDEQPGKVSPVIAKAENPAPQPADPSLEEILAKVSVYEKITQANPRNHRSWDTLGKLYKSLGRFQDAIQCYLHATSQAPNCEQYFYYLGLLYTIEQQHDEAIKAFENVLRLNSEYILAHSALAGIYHRQGLVAKANQHIAAALPKMESESAYNKACFNAICGDVELAIKFLRSALEDDDTPLEWVRSDPDLESIRQDERYQQLILEFEAPARKPQEGEFFASEPNGENNQMLPFLNQSLAR